MLMNLNSNCAFSVLENDECYYGDLNRGDLFLYCGKVYSKIGVDAILINVPKEIVTMVDCMPYIEDAARTLANRFHENTRVIRITIDSFAVLGEEEIKPCSICVDKEDNLYIYLTDGVFYRFHICPRLYNSHMPFKSGIFLDYSEISPFLKDFRVVWFVEIKKLPPRKKR